MNITNKRYGISSLPDFFEEFQMSLSDIFKEIVELRRTNNEYQKAVNFMACKCDNRMNLVKELETDNDNQKKMAGERNKRIKVKKIVELE